MAIRQTRFQIKSNQNSAAPFSGSTLLIGEPIVNTAAGIMMFSGVTTGTNDWVPAGSGGNAGFFEVGSNLNQLKIRDKITEYSGVTDLSGLFLSGTSTGFVLASISDINTFSAFTYDDNTFTIYESNGETNSVTVNYFSGLTIQGDFTVTGNTNVQSLSATSVSIIGLSPSQVLYVGSAGEIKGESNFNYDEGSDTLNVDNIEVSNNVVIQGDLTVLGTSVSAFTSNLFVEDPNLIINYNPTGSTSVTSVNAGLTIQDGGGTSLSDVNLDIVRMQYLTGTTINNVPNVSEYVSLTGFSNRGWITQLNDIVIRSTSVTDNGVTGDINGVRVLAEFDILDGGSY